VRSLDSNAEAAAEPGLERSSSSVAPSTAASSCGATAASRQRRRKARRSAGEAASTAVVLPGGLAGAAAVAPCGHAHLGSSVAPTGLGRGLTTDKAVSSDLCPASLTTPRPAPSNAFVTVEER
jgi:hypothetical protein